MPKNSSKRINIFLKLYHAYEILIDTFSRDYKYPQLFDLSYTEKTKLIWFSVKNL